MDLFRETSQRWSSDAMHSMLFEHSAFLLLYSHDSYRLFPCGWSVSKENPNKRKDGLGIIGWRARAQASRNGPLPRSEEDRPSQHPQPQRAKWIFLVPDAVIFPLSCTPHTPFMLSLLGELSNDRISSRSDCACGMIGTRDLYLYSVTCGVGMSEFRNRSVDDEGKDSRGSSLVCTGTVY
jgi:hypothetical protein